LASERRSKRKTTRSQKAQNSVDELAVKRHQFAPSGREIWTVVGTDCDFMVNYDPSNSKQPFCSCDDYHFRVLGGSIAECYHLMAVKKAREQKKFSTIIFSDDEYEDFLRGLLSDIFSHIS
jgi:predicted nucleic acid-binding Zn finger protein